MTFKIDMDHSCSPPPRLTIEWRTVVLIAGCYLGWFAAGGLYGIAPLLAVALLVPIIVLHASLQHEAIHRHPTRDPRVDEALVWLPLGLLIPFRRFRDQHLRHHRDETLTHPHEDPESFYIAQGDWQRLPGPVRTLLAWNNRLAVRIAIGPAIMAVGFLRGEMRALSGADATSARIAWGLHGLGVAAVLLVVTRVFAMPLAVYALAAYLAQSVLAIRSFCEHQWTEEAGSRTVIVERSVLGWLFLNNNLHAVHHARPDLAWYALPAAYRARRAEWQAVNRGYVFSGYRTVLRRFAMRAKEPAMHPQR